MVARGAISARHPGGATAQTDARSHGCNAHSAPIHTPPVRADGRRPLGSKQVAAARAQNRTGAKLGPKC